MKNLKNALLLKQLYQLKQLGYKYTSATLFQEEEPNLHLPNTLDTLKKQALECHLCMLSKSRQKVVFGEGKMSAKLMFIGDIPSSSDDSVGKIFTGRTGELFTKMIENVLELKREDIYITNLLKCRTPQNQSPSPTHIHTCYAYLLKEIELINPTLVVTLGDVAYQYLTGDDSELSKVRGSLHKQDTYTIIPIYHPSYLLKNPSSKKEVFQDLLKIKELM